MGGVRWEQGCWHLRWHPSAGIRLEERRVCPGGLSRIWLLRRKSQPGERAEKCERIADAAGAEVGIDPAKNPEKVSGFGHSLGCSAALMAVEEFHLKSAVLCSPFTSTHEMAELRTGLAKDAPFAHQFDNRQGLKELEKNKGTCWIIHGTDDRIIPVLDEQNACK